MNTSTGGGAKAYPGVNSHTVSSSGTKERGAPIGTIHNGRQKVSSNPSKWVELSSGKSYDGHNSKDAHDTHKTGNLKEGHEKVLDKVAKEIHPDDVGQAGRMLSEWVNKKVAAKNLQQASNVESTSTKQMSGTHQAKAQKAFDEAGKAFSDLTTFLKDSKRRKASASV